MGGMGSQGITRAGGDSVSLVAGDSVMVPTCTCRGRAQEMSNGFCQHFCLGESCPSNSCPKARQFSYSRHVPVGFPAAAPVLELRRMNLSASIPRPFNRNAWDSRSPLSHSVTIPTGFHSKKLWGLLFSALEPWICGAWCGAGTPHSLRGFLHLGYPS